MTLFELYALFGMPLVVLAIGLGVAYFIAPRDRLHPGK